MKTGWKVAVVAAAILLVGGLTVAGAKAGKAGKGAKKGTLAAAAERHPVKWLAWWLDLTPQQVTQIKDILQQEAPEALTVRIAVAGAKRALHEEVISGATDLKIRATAAVLGQAVGTAAVLRAKTLTAVKGVLDADQKKEFEKILTKMPGFQLKVPGNKAQKKQTSEPNEPNQPAKK